jgi:hypothetical protein
MTPPSDRLYVLQRHNKPPSFEVHGFDSSDSDDSEGSNCFSIFVGRGYKSTHYFNITEDWGVDISSCKPPKPPGLVGRCKPRTEPSGWEDLLTASKPPNGQPSGGAWAVHREADSKLVCHEKGVYDGAWVDTQDLELTLFARETVFGPNPNRWRDKRRVALQELYGIESDED